MARVVDLRRQYPAWSKHKIQAMMVPEKLVVSVSTVGRILKRRGLIDRRMSAKRRRAAKQPKARFPRGFKVSRPGDYIQMDTKHIMLVGGRKLYQFTAIDVLTKRRVLQIYATQSARNGALFLEECLRQFPFRVRAVQTDNGAPFQKEFAQAAATNGIPHYYTYPRHPKQNTFVEISHGADEREFYRQGNVWSDAILMRKKIKEWEMIWNEVRPHQALGYLTPQAYLKKWQTSGLPTRDVITLQT
jgi:putative transposase